MRFEHSSSGAAAARPDAVPLFHAAWLFAIGIAATHWLWLRPGLMLAAIAPTAVLCGIAAMRAQRVLWVPLAVLWCLLGAWCGLMEPYPAPAPQVAALSDGLMRTMEGTVIDAAPVRNEAEQNLNEDEANSAANAVEPSQRPTQRIDVRLGSLEVVTDSEDRQTAVAGIVRLTVRWAAGTSTQAAAQTFHCGDRIRADARLLPPAVYHDPGVWSRADYLLDQGITSTASIAIDRVSIRAHNEGAGLQFRCRMSEWQHGVTDRLMGLPQAMRNWPVLLRISPEDAVMLAAMVAGDRTFLTHSLRVGFERTGSFHMLIVSGFHLAIVAGCIFWVARRVRLPRIPATALTIAASFAYALFTGFAVPVQRSLWMVTLYLIGRLFYRERSALNTIGFASLCLLAVSPRSLFDSGLQMTLLAVVSIAGVAAPLLEGTVHPLLNATRDLRLVAIDVKLAPRVAQFRTLMRMAAERIEGVANKRVAWVVFPWLVRLALRVVELVVVSCVIELAMTLPMAIYFHRITVFALPVNLFILPLLVVLIPIALLTLAALVVWPGVAALPAAAVALVLHAGVLLVRLFGALRFGDLRIASPLFWQCAAFYALLGTAILMAHRALLRDNRLLRWSAWTTLLLGGFVAVAPRTIAHPRNAMLAEAIDVGQGDSMLIVTPDGKTLLVDGGGFGGGPVQAQQDFDFGEEVISPVLWDLGIRHLDAVALSHAHSDHMGGLPTVLRNFSPDELWVGDNPPGEAYDALLDEAASMHVLVRSMRAGDAFGFGDAKVNVQAPARDYEAGAEPANNDSLVLHVGYRATSVLLEGDAEAPIEQAMLGEAGLESTLLKVGHHGSTTSTTPEFLARVAPKWAVISCGLRNRYGHPRQEILAELEAAHVRTFRTDTNGISCFRLDGTSVAALPECGWKR
jgi:competence protein ComEC